MEKKPTNIVPDQHTGVAIKAESRKILDNEETASRFFEEVKGRLQSVNRWHDIAGSTFARFQLIDQEGIEVNRSPREGDYFRIDIPGPGPSSGAGYDWVQVEAIKTESTPTLECFGFRVRPAQNPQNSGQDIAHFFSHTSTSSFIVAREGTKITAAIYDRNIKPNKDAAPILDKVRDMITGAAGALIFSKLQWKMLADGLLVPQ